MYTPVETTQVLQSSQVVDPAASLAMAPGAQLSYGGEALQVLPPIALPTQVTQLDSPAPEVSQVVVPQVEQAVSVAPVPTIAVSQVVPTVSLAPVAVSQVVPAVSMVAQPVPVPVPQPVALPPPMPKPLTPSPPYEAFVPPTPVTKSSITASMPPQIYQFYQAVPVPPPAPAPVTTTSYVNVPVTTSVNVPVTTSVNVPVSSSMNLPVTNTYSTLTAPAPVTSSSSVLLGAPQYQTFTASSFM